MAILLNKYNSVLDSTDKEDEISRKDHEKTSTNISSHFSNSSSSATSNVKDILLLNHELDLQESSWKKKNIHPHCSSLAQLKKSKSPVSPQQWSTLKN